MAGVEVINTPLQGLMECGFGFMGRCPMLVYFVPWGRTWSRGTMLWQGDWYDLQDYSVLDGIGSGICSKSVPKEAYFALLGQDMVVLHDAVAGRSVHPYRDDSKLDETGFGMALLGRLYKQV